MVFSGHVVRSFDFFLWFGIPSHVGWCSRFWFSSNTVGQFFCQTWCARFQPHSQGNEPVMIFLSKFVMCMQNNEQHISDWWLCLFPCIENCMTGSKKWCEGWNHVPHPVHRLGNVPVNFFGHNYALLPNLSVKLFKQFLQICCSQPALSCACSNQRHRSMLRKNATYVQNKFVDSQSSTHAWGWCQQKNVQTFPNQSNCLNAFPFFMYMPNDGLCYTNVWK